MVCPMLISIVRSMRGAKYRDLLKEYAGISYIEGAAKFGAGAISVADEQIVAGKTVVATGARAAAQRTVIPRTSRL